MATGVSLPRPVSAENNCACCLIQGTAWRWVGPHGRAALAKAVSIRFMSGDRYDSTYAAVALFSPDPEGDAKRGGGRIPSADAAGRHVASAIRRHLLLAAPRLPCPENHRADRARGA